jgi:hypothetical protein
MNGRFALAPLACLLALTTPASAHAPIMGIGGVAGGFLHALLIPEHGMALVALGLALGRQETLERRYELLMFTVAVTAGLLAVWLVADATFSGDVLLAVTGILGLSVAIAWMPRSLNWALVVVAGVAFALDSKPDEVATDELIRMLIGSWLGSALALAVLAEVAFLLQRGAGSIAARILGSWIAAIAILDLSLRIATRLATG